MRTPQKLTYPAESGKKKILITVIVELKFVRPHVNLIIKKKYIILLNRPVLQSSRAEANAYLSMKTVETTRF